MLLGQQFQAIVAEVLASKVVTGQLKYRLAADDDAWGQHIAENEDFYIHYLWAFDGQWNFDWHVIDKRENPSYIGHIHAALVVKEAVANGIPVNKIRW